MNADEIIRSVRATADPHKTITDFPLEAFPKKMACIISRMVEYNRYSLDFIGSAILSASATAIGNSRKIRIYGDFIVNPALYMLFVARSGMGKTPPTNAAYRLIKEMDSEAINSYKSALYEYEKAKEETESKSNLGLVKPKLVQTVLSDFTLESLMRTHSTNLRGVVIKSDEILGMINSANRYTSTPLVSQLLSAWSGESIKCTRATLDLPMVVSDPCINIIGSIQTKLFPSLIEKGLQDNGFIDRMLIVYPARQIIPKFDRNADNATEIKTVRDEYDSVIRKLMSIDFDSLRPKVMELTGAAASLLDEGMNDIIEIMNATEQDSDNDSRDNKQVMMVAKLALILQLLRWACDESDMTEVDETSVSGAILLNNYFQECYYRLMDQTQQLPDISTRRQVMLNNLPNEFCTAQAIDKAVEMQVAPRTVKRWLATLLREGSIIKKGYGYYTKCRR